MKEVDKKKTSINNQPKRSKGNDKRDRNLRQENGQKCLNNRKPLRKASNVQSDSAVACESNVGKEPSEVYGTMVIHYVDDATRYEEASKDLNSSAMASKEKNSELLGGQDSDSEEETSQGTEVSDSETIKDSVSSVGDSPTAEDEKVEKGLKASESTAKKRSSINPLPSSRLRSDTVKNKNQLKTVDIKAATNSRGEKSRTTTMKCTYRNAKNKEIPPKSLSESSEGLDDKVIEETKEVEIMDKVSNGPDSVISDKETFDAEENGAHEDVIRLEHKVDEMERRLVKLEDELRVVAALEVALYSVVPEHGSSVNILHTPARRLSRLYIHACKFWTQDKRAIIAKNTVSGIVLISKSCGNDVPRLTYWLSNAIVLREIIFQTFGSSQKSNTQSKLRESSVSSNMYDGNSANLIRKGSSGNREMNGFMPLIDDWQETGTFTAALEKVESWIFSRIVESVWWQAITPHMQSPAQFSSSKSSEKVMGLALGDQKQNIFSVDLWKNAFHDALQRLCPLQAGGHDCGCLPVLARMVMEECISRLDVAMFNAILRESAHEIPTDPVSDPIVDCTVLPIPAGDLSFGSGAQLKNAVGNWSRSLTDMFGIDADDSLSEDQNGYEDYESWGGDKGPKCFPLLNSLSDLLMLPKDMLIDKAVRHEVCPLISLPLVKRVLCNFSPDEFCPDPVPGSVLEALNAESVQGSASSFPYTAASVVYFPPQSAQIGKKVAELGGRSLLIENVSALERKGYTSDEELEELEFPLISVLDKLPESPTVITNGNGRIKEQHASHAGINSRYGLLNEVWSAV